MPHHCIAVACADHVARGQMGGFTPFRRDVDWWQATPAPIRPLLDLLELTQGKTNWGYGFRFGLVQISPADFAAIAGAMGAVV